jgi:uncharacterized protein YcbK (DUF882 family)
MGDLSKNFSRREFECKCGCGFNTVDAELVKVLQVVRDYFKESITITSACRCEKHNNRVGGGKNSQHKLGRAADIVVSNVSPAEVQEYLDSRYPIKYGLGSYSDFTHIDTRSGVHARW